MSLEIPSAKPEEKSQPVSKQVFGQDFNEPLIHQLVISYLSAGRSGTKAQKTRAEVSGGGAKPWKQKGSGRARAGTTRSPLWRTGGVTFAAGNRNYEKKINKKMYRSGMRSIFSELLRQGRLVVSDSLLMTEAKTRLFVAEMERIGFVNGLIITKSFDNNLFLAARNVANIQVCEVRYISPVELVNSSKIMLTREALLKIEEALA
jgi:large subunit ribosomal protein L4